MLKNLRRRHLYAWILLGVFLPMLVMASVHVHTAYEETAVSCPVCVHHVHHDGHFGPSTIFRQLSLLPFSLPLCLLSACVMRRTSCTACSRGYWFRADRLLPYCFFPDILLKVYGICTSALLYGQALLYLYL